MNRLKLSDIVKHNKQYINFNKDGRSKEDTIEFYTEHYTDNWIYSPCIDVDVIASQIREILS